MVKSCCMNSWADMKITLRWMRNQFWIYEEYSVIRNPSSIACSFKSDPKVTTFNIWRTMTDIWRNDVRTMMKYKQYNGVTSPNSSKKASLTFPCKNKGLQAPLFLFLDLRGKRKSSIRRNLHFIFYFSPRFFLLPTFSSCTCPYYHPFFSFSAFGSLSLQLISSLCSFLVLSFPVPHFPSPFLPSHLYLPPSHVIPSLFFSPLTCLSITLISFPSLVFLPSPASSCLPLPYSSFTIRQRRRGTEGLSGFRCSYALH